MECAPASVTVCSIKQARQGSVLLFVVIIMGILSWVCLKTGMCSVMNYELVQSHLVHEQQMQLLDSYMTCGIAFCQLYITDLQSHLPKQPITLEFIPQVQALKTSRGSSSISLEQDILFIQTVVQIDDATKLSGSVRLQIIHNEQEEKKLKILSWSVQEV